MYITKVEIENLKAINNLILPFEPPYCGWNVIIGDNGAGKSTLLKAISLALLGSDEGMKLRENWAKWVGQSKSETTIKLFLNRDNQYDLGVGKRKTEEAIFSGIKISKISNQKNLNSLRRKKIPIDSLSTPINIETIESDDEAIGNAEDYYWLFDYSYTGWFSASFGAIRRLSNFQNSSNEKDEYKSRVLKANSPIFEDVPLKNLLPWLKQLRFEALENSRSNSDNKDENPSQKILNLFVNFFNNGNFYPNSIRIVEITSQGIMIEDANKIEIDIQDLSDGYRSITCIVFELFYQFIESYGLEVILKNFERGIYKIDLPGVVLIDEIDAHLHPKWQTSIGQKLTYIFPKVQFIVTSHSPLICRSVKNSLIYRLRTPGSEEESGVVDKNEKNKLIYGNILDAYGTELFGEEITRSQESNQKLTRLGYLNAMAAMGQITQEEKIERAELQKILSTDDPTGFENTIN